MTKQSSAADRSESSSSPPPKETESVLSSKQGETATQSGGTGTQAFARSQQEKSGRQSRERGSNAADKERKAASRAAKLQQTRGNQAVGRAVIAAKGRGAESASNESEQSSSSERTSNRTDRGTSTQNANAEENSHSSASSTESGRTPDVGTGTPLQESTKAALSSRFETPLDGVRLHTGPQAASVAASQDASAVSSARHIFFNEGQYRPESSVGRGLLTHELAHAAQQPSGGTDAVHSGAVVSPSHPAEQEARTATKRVAAGSDAAVTGTHASRQMVMRQPAGTQAPAVPSGALTPEFGPQVGPEAEVSASGPPPLDLQGSATVDPAAVERRLPEDETKGVIPVSFGSLAAGHIGVEKTKAGEYRTPKLESLRFSHPGLAPLADQDVSPVLAVDLTEGVLTGFVSLSTGTKRKPKDNALLDWIQDNPALMGWAGMDDLDISTYTNGIEAGQLVMKVNGFSFQLGGFIRGNGSFGIVGDSFVFDATANVEVDGLESGQLEIQRLPDGTLAGTAELAVAFDTFSGTVRAAYGNGTVEMEGTAAYQGEKFDGSVTILVAHKKRAEELARERLGADAFRDAADEVTGEPVDGAEEPAVGPKPGPRGVAGFGEITVNLTEWLAGSAEVIVDGKGDVTVVGDVSPPATVTLFEQKEYIHKFPRIEIKAIYGVPVVGNLNIFANIGVDTIAKLGPGTLYDIVLEGTYSTDPDLYQNYSLAASLNVSAYAGIRVRAEGGVGITIVAHDLKAGVGIESTAGIRGYVDARPKIGYREQAAPEEGKTGEFYIAGHMDIAAQPTISLGGDLFVELDSPWYSPAPDKKWTWPMDSLEYPLPGEFGIGADLNYVLGSDAVPDITFGEVAFDSQKFMTDVMNDNVPTGSSAETQTEGTFEDAVEVPDEPTVETGKSEGSGAIDQPPVEREAAGGGKPEPAQGQQTGMEGEVPADAVRRQWLAALEQIELLAAYSKRDPLTKTEIDLALAKLRRDFRFTELLATQRGSDWKIHAEMNPKQETTVKREESEEEPEDSEVQLPEEAQLEAGETAPDQQSLFEAQATQIAVDERVRELELDETMEEYTKVTESVRGKALPGHQTVGALGSRTGPETVGSGAKDLSPEQRRTASKMRVVPMKGRKGTHAEARLLLSVADPHSNKYHEELIDPAVDIADRERPDTLYSDNEFCPYCEGMILSAGGRIRKYGGLRKIAEFDVSTDTEDLYQASRERDIVFVNGFVVEAPEGREEDLEKIIQKKGPVKLYLDDLKKLTSISDRRARQILDELLENGYYTDQKDLIARVGLPESSFEDIKDNVSFKRGNLELLRK